MNEIIGFLAVYVDDLEDYLDYGVCAHGRITGITSNGEFIINGDNIDPDNVVYMTADCWEPNR